MSINTVSMRNRNVARYVSLLVALIALSAGTFVPAEAQVSAEPRIAFLNPSGFATRTGMGVVVTDNKPARPAEGSETYRISAWISDAPADAGVEFELLKNGVSLETIDSGITLEMDTYEADWNIPATTPDGPYTLRATLFSNNEAITSVDQDITIVRVAERMQITYPGLDATKARPGDGSFGTFAPLANELPEEGAATRSLPIGNVDGNHTGGAPGTGTSYVRAFYTVSEPGSTPEWIPCGTQGAPGQASGFAPSAANDGVRCTLQDPAHQTAVTAVAAVANDSEGGFDPAMNGAGDAVRVTEAYAQTPTGLNLTEGSAHTMIEPEDDGSYACHLVGLFLEDERGREILGANIDVKASGPNDKLRFDTGLLNEAGLQPPDRHHAAFEPGYDCFGNNAEGSLSDQADHQIFGGPDHKHVESDSGGTEDDGYWGFSLWTPKESVGEKYSARFTVWVDELDDGCLTNDDRFTEGELAISGNVGFGAMPPQLEPFTPAPLTPCTPPLEGPVLRTISFRSDSGWAREGEQVTVTGMLSSTYLDCVNEEKVNIKWRRPGGRFTKVAQATTDAEGFFSADVSPKPGRNIYRAVAPKTETCLRAASEVVRIRVPR